MVAPAVSRQTVPDLAEFELVIGGMSCAACSGRVQAKLNKVDGVTAAVNLSTERAYITAPGSVGAAQLVAIVEAAGYTAELAAPVALWAAWPFRQVALKQARHLSSSMDTLVSLGILAACGWSVYAMFFLDRSRGGRSGPQNILHGSGGGIYLEVAASVTTFLLAGRLYEARARRTAGQAMRDLAAAA
jgi:Cu+-exporting ATPase